MSLRLGNRLAGSCSKTRAGPQPQYLEHEAVALPIRGAARIALNDPNVDDHPAIAVQDVEGIEEISEDEMTEMVVNIFGTDDEAHLPTVREEMGGALCRVLKLGR